MPLDVASAPFVITVAGHGVIVLAVHTPRSVKGGPPASVSTMVRSREVAGSSTHPMSLRYGVGPASSACPASPYAYRRMVIRHGCPIGLTERERTWRERQLRVVTSWWSGWSGSFLSIPSPHTRAPLLRLWGCVYIRKIVVKKVTSDTMIYYNIFCLFVIIVILPWPN